MKNNILKTLSLLTICASFAGCSEEGAPVVNGASFEIQSYDDFLWEKDVVDTIKFEINAEFKECSDVTTPLTLVLCDANGEIVSQSLATVFVNGVQSEGNKIEMMPANGDLVTKVGIVISASALSEDCTFYWNLRSMDRTDGMKVVGAKDDGSEIGLDDSGIIYGTDICVKNVHVANTLEVWTNIIFWAILIITVTVIVLVQLFAKRFKATHLITVFVTVKGLRNGIMGYKAGLKGSQKIILTSDPKKKQGFWAMLFRAKTSYVYVAGWPAEIELRLSGGSITHEVLTHNIGVRQRMDTRTHAMVLDCSTPDGEFKIEYMM